ncbi:MAG: hypothetical protein ACJ75J_02565, partial [Cytophagaceae bacterium]
DFFTNASSHPNPRHFFGYTVLFLQKITGTHWYTILFLLKTTFITLIPPLIFLFIYGIVRDKIKNEFQNTILNFFLFILILYLIAGNTSLFAIAWWPPVFYMASSQTLSLFLFLIGSYFLFYIKSNVRYFYLLFWGASVTLHFTVGFSLLALYLMSTIMNFRARQTLLVLVFCIGLPAAINLFAFSQPTDVKLSAQAFIEIYVKLRHPSHYWFSQLGSLNSFPWYINYLFVILLLIIPAIYFLYKREKAWVLVSVLFILSFSAAPFLQLFFTEIVPAKFPVAFGPTRFCFTGLWMVCILYSILLMSVLGKINLKFVHIPRVSVWISFPLIVFSITLAVIIAKDNPYEKYTLRDPEFYNWVQNNTRPEEIFASFEDDYVYLLPLIYKRAVFVANGFPFTENFFLEYADRYTLLYGNYKILEHYQGSMNERYDHYYGDIDPDRLRHICAKYRLDYLVMRPGAGKNISGFAPVFQNEKVKIYKAADIIK